MSKPQPTKPCFATGDGIICAGLPRSGTASLTAALGILGIGPVHHTLGITDIREIYGWGQAGWCNLPYLRETRLRRATDRLPFYMNPADALLPWVRADWDRLIGHQRVTTDLGAIFSAQLIAAYPEARVVLVERAVEPWTRSFGTLIINGVCSGMSGFVRCVLGPRVGYPRAAILYDLCMGWLGARSGEEAWRRLPAKHAEHYAMVRRLVPPERLLVYRYEDGWEPLCRFLGVEVPEEPFPHVNDLASAMQYMAVARREILWELAKRLVVWSLGLCIFGFVMSKWLHR